MLFLEEVIVWMVKAWTLRQEIPEKQGKLWVRIVQPSSTTQRLEKCSGSPSPPTIDDGGPRCRLSVGSVERLEPYDARRCRFLGTMTHVDCEHRDLRP